MGLLSPSRYPTWIKAPALFLAGAAAAGIIGNRSDDLLLKAIEELRKLVVATAGSCNIWLTAAIPATILLLAGFLYCRLHIAHSILHIAHSILDKRLKMEDTFIHLLSNLDIKANDDEKLKKLTAAYTKEIVSFLESQGIKKCFAIVFCQSTGNTDSPLKAWTLERSTTPHEEATRVYEVAQSASERERGIVGEAFKAETPQIQVVTVKSKGDKWLVVDQFDKDIQELASEPSYKSIAIIPIPNENSETIGILCIYGTEINSFLKPGINTFLTGFSLRLGIAVQLKVASMQASPGIPPSSPGISP